MMEVALNSAVKNEATAETFSGFFFGFFYFFPVDPLG